MREQGYGAVRIPSDIERADRVLGPFSARQVAIIGSAVAGLWLVFMMVRDVVPLVAFAALAVPVVAGASAFALVQRDGVSLDRLALAAVRQRLSARRLVPAPAGVAAPPSFIDKRVAAGARPLPGPLALPVSAIADDGVIDLGEQGCVALVACSTVSFALATPAEQEGMVAAFARCLNSLATPVQVVVRAERLELTHYVQRLEDAAPGLPHPALETAAREHAAYLAGLADRADLLWRQVLLVVRQPLPGSGRRQADGHALADQVRRQADDLARALGAAGIGATVLDQSAATAAVTAACDPNRWED